MTNKCDDCILNFNGYCHATNNTELIEGIVTKCDYYLQYTNDNNFKVGFIKGFRYCDEMKKQPQIEKIENRAKKEVFARLNKILEVDQFPEYVEDDLINFLKEEGAYNE